MAPQTEQTTELVEKNAELQHIIIDFIEPQYHDESVLWNEDIGQEDYVLSPKDWDNHTLSEEESDVYDDAQSRYEYLRMHRACFHQV